MDYVQIAIHAVVTIAAIATIAVRLEHRLTKIETDVTWLKEYAKNNCEGSKEDE